MGRGRTQQKKNTKAHTNEVEEKRAVMSPLGSPNACTFITFECLRIPQDTRAILAIYRLIIKDRLDDNDNNDILQDRPFHLVYLMQCWGGVIIVWITFFLEGLSTLGMHEALFQIRLIICLHLATHVNNNV